jgi:acetoin utilization deacetylase AcuC-like enzyme
MTMATGLVWDERFAWFYRGLVRRGPFFSPLEAFDTSESKERIRELLVASGLADELTSLAPRLMTEEELLRHHTAEYLAKVKALSDGEGGDAGENAYLGRNCYDIARLSAGGTLVALESVLEGRVDNVYALVRPCGHHATRDFGRGFCIFSNIPLAILAAKANRLVERVAVVDWDVHHGNGTQDAFYSDPSVLTVSIHQDGYYPMDSGGLEERGEGPGRGYNLNVPLPPGSGHGAYVETVKQVVVPALQRFRPEVIVVASGLDANAYDPLARMMCHTETFREMTTLLMAAAQESCGGRLVACHEGGYAPYYVPWCALAVVETFAGIRTSCKDPSLDYLVGRPGQELQPHQAEVIRKAASAASDIPRA